MGFLLSECELQAILLSGWPLAGIPRRRRAHACCLLNFNSQPAGPTCIP
jgi:hypothetical protein